MWYLNIKNSTSKMLRSATKDFVPLQTKLCNIPDQGAHDSSSTSQASRPEYAPGDTFHERFGRSHIMDYDYQWETFLDVAYLAPYYLGCISMTLSLTARYYLAPHYLGCLSVTLSLTLSLNTCYHRVSFLPVRSVVLSPTGFYHPEYLSHLLPSVPSSEIS